MSVTLSTVIAIIVILFLAVFAVIGFRKGFLRILFTTFSAVIIIAVSFLAAKPLASFLTEKTSIGTAVEERIGTYITDKTNEAGSTLVIGGEDTFIDTLPLPGFLKTDIKVNNTLKRYVEMGVNSFSGYLTARLTSIVMNALSFAVLALIIAIAFRLIVFLLKIISKIPIIHGINRIFGGLLGLAEGILILWCICIFIMVFSGTAFGHSCMEVIAGSKILTFIYDHNLPVMAFSHFAGLL